MTSPIDVVYSIESLRKEIAAHRRDGRQVGLVPTMGALHAGHLSLAKQSVQSCDVTVATIFVNPLQFSAGEDLSRYPRTLDADLAALDNVGVDLVFVPEPEVIYPPGCTTTINPPKIAEPFEGTFRSTHFRGVCTIVLKLFNMVQPDRAFFGQKDFQQVRVVECMVRDLNIPIEIVMGETIRDADGLALSSRNVYLDVDQRKIALSLSQTLDWVANEIQSGAVDASEIMNDMRRKLEAAGVNSIDYAVVAEPDTLKIVESLDRPMIALIAAHVGSTRLIDNRLID